MSQKNDNSADLAKVVASVILSPYGTVAVFDGHGNQIPELQVPFYELWAEDASARGYDLSHVLVDLPAVRGLLRKGEHGWRVDP